MNLSNFLNFKSIKEYQLSSEKFLDFFFGIFVIPTIFGYAFDFLAKSSGYEVLRNLSYLFEILLILYFYRKRRYLAYGLIINVIVGVIFLVFLAGPISKNLGIEL